MNVRLTNNDYAKFLQKEEDRQLQLINKVFNTTYKKSKYVVQALDEELKNYDSILNSVEYSRYHTNMEVLSKELATLKSGINGEAIAKRALKPLYINPNYIMLENVCFSDGEDFTECDYLVLAGNVIYDIEVKNYSSKVVIDSDGIMRHKEAKIDLVEKFNMKDILIRNALSNNKDIIIEHLLMFTSLDLEIIRDFNNYKIFRGGNIVNYILKNTKKYGVNDLKNQELSKQIIDSSVLGLTKCEVNIELIQKDFEALLKKYTKLQSPIKRFIRWFESSVNNLVKRFNNSRNIKKNGNI